ncbi:hypothetical protein [Chitinolyticbacter meiyuanensis]|uniref:hypothetical protein n=1 Tax=Chitinolyticbacter meiyuanensis TaxID=682798 RepID=UPI0011E5C04E|nr:hypothetical protein [Chitinolyticbacter meiyuanensis]
MPSVWVDVDACEILPELSDEEIIHELERRGKEHLAFNSDVSDEIEQLFVALNGGNDQQIRSIAREIVYKTLGRIAP